MNGNIYDVQRCYVKLTKVCPQDGFVISFPKWYNKFDYDITLRQNLIFGSKREENYRPSFPSSVRF